MRLKRLLFPAATLLILFIGHRGASAFMIAKAIAPPHASRASVLRLVIHPSFSMATPHRNLLTEIKLDFIPSAQACGNPDCDGTEARPHCPEGCPQGYCYCPGCQISGCTPYYCTYTGSIKKYCVAATNTNPNDVCYTCETDHNTSCNPPPL